MSATSEILWRVIFHYPVVNHSSTTPRVQCHLTATRAEPLPKISFDTHSPPSMSLSVRHSQRILFKPARSSRHRTACFALYRALVRQAVGVPLPDDLQLPPSASGRAKTHPVHHLVKRQFRRNADDVSKRLVFAALAAGYNVCCAPLLLSNL